MWAKSTYPGIPDHHLDVGFDRADKNDDNMITMDELIQTIDKAGDMDRIDAHLMKLPSHFEAEVQRRFNERMRDLPRDCERLFDGKW